MGRSKHDRRKVFISCSRNDKEFLNEVRRHFKPFSAQVEVWDDGKILPGQLWRTEIEKAINETRVAVLLVSTDFLGSDFIVTNELPMLLDAAENDGATVLMLILKPCFIEGFPQLAKFQAMHALDRPMVAMGETEREEILVNLVRQALKILGEG